MKRKISSLCAVLLMFSILIISFAGTDVDAMEITGEDIDLEQISGTILSDDIPLSDSGAAPLVVGTHGGHQRRMVRTSHGTYVAYISDEVSGGMHELSLLRVDEEGNAEILYQTIKAYDAASCAPYVFCDEEENVYMTTFYPDSWDSKPNVEEWITLQVMAYNKDTGIVTEYHTNRKSAEPEGWGYTTPVYDPAANKIYALLSGGAYKEQASLCWFVFDLETMTWEPEQHLVKMPYRHGYMYAYPDLKGGFYFVGLQNRWKESVPGSEIIKHNDWIFDQLNLIYVPNVYENTYSISPIYEGDWSRLMTENLCPDNGCSQHGDIYLDKNGYLHVFSTSMFIVVNDQVEGYEPDDRVERKSWHMVFDVSDPGNIKQLYKKQMFYMNGTEEDCYYRARATEDNDGQMYIFAIQDQKKVLEVWKATLKQGETMDYTYELMESKEYDLRSDYTLDLAGKQNGSKQDDIVELMYGTMIKGDVCEYSYIKADLHPNKLRVTLNDMKVTMTGEGEKPVTLQGGEFQFQLLNEQKEILQTVTNNSDGTLIFEAITYTKEGTYRYFISQVKGEDAGIIYDESEVAVTVVITSTETGILKAEKIIYEGGGIFNNVKDESVNTGDNRLYWSYVLLIGLAGGILIVLNLINPDAMKKCK